MHFHMFIVCDECGRGESFLIERGSNGEINLPNSIQRDSTHFTVRKFDNGFILDCKCQNSEAVFID